MSPTNITAGHLMETRLITLSPDEDIFQAIDYFTSHKISGLPVLTDEKKIVGILTQLHCIQAIINASNETIPTPLVKQFMDPDFIRVTPDTGLLRLMELFQTFKLRRVPVVDPTGILLGQVSRLDILRHARKFLDKADTREAAFLFLSQRSQRKDLPLG